MKRIIENRTKTTPDMTMLPYVRILVDDPAEVFASGNAPLT